MKKFLTNPEFRKYIYNVLIALVPLGVAAGLFTFEEGGMWLAVASAVLGTGGFVLATNNVTPTPPGTVIEEGFEAEVVSVGE